MPEEDPYYRNIYHKAKRLIKCVVFGAASMSILIIYHNEVHFLHETELFQYSLYMLYAFFWAILRRLNFIYRRFGTLCSIFIRGWV